MRATDRKEIYPTINPEAAEAMAKYGITRVSVDYFHYKEFRYTNLDDAIAGHTAERVGHDLDPKAAYSVLRCRRPRCRPSI
jgi:hypothetical protein